MPGVVRFEKWHRGLPLIALGDTGDLAYWTKESAEIFVGVDTGLLNLQGSLLMQSTFTAALTVDELANSQWGAQIVF